MHNEIENTINAAARIISESRRIFVLTGAGISAESGVPTFRGGGDTTPAHETDRFAEMV